MFIYQRKERASSKLKTKQNKNYTMIKKNKKILCRSPLTEFSGISNTMGLMRKGGL